MKVQELIDILGKLPKDATIVGDPVDYYPWVKDIRIEMYPLEDFARDPKRQDKAYKFTKTIPSDNLVYISFS